MVCEKQAALEVVHKRLAAEGLDHRVFRVENTVSDRAKVLKALQTQVPQLFQHTDQTRNIATASAGNLPRRSTKRKLISTLIIGRYTRRTLGLAMPTETFFPA